MAAWTDHLQKVPNNHPALEESGAAEVGRLPWARQLTVARIDEHRGAVDEITGTGVIVQRGRMFEAFLERSSGSDVSVRHARFLFARVTRCRRIPRAHVGRGRITPVEYSGSAGYRYQRIARRSPR